MSSEFAEVFKRYAHIPRTKIDYWTLRKLRSLKSKQVGQKSWAEWFKYLTRDTALNPTLHERIQEGTAKTLLPRWMQNYSDNLPYIRFGIDTKIEIPKEPHQSTIADLVNRTPILEMDPEYPKTKGPVSTHKGMKVKNAPKGSAIVVGRGPSLFKHKHCEQLRESGYGGLIIASDGALTPLLDAGVVPDIVVSVDGSPVIKKYFEHPRLKKYGNKIKWIVTVTVSNEVFQTAKKAGMQIYWFNPMFDDWRQNESWTRLQVLMSRTDKFPMGVPRANAGGCSGNCAWILAMSLFKTAPVCLIGMDAGYPEGTKLEDTQYFSSVLKEAKGDVGIIKRAYKHFYHPTFRTKSFCDFVFYHYRQAFLEMQQSTPIWYRHYGGTINATESGTLFGPGIKCMYFKEFLSKYPK